MMLYTDLDIVKMEDQTTLSEKPAIACWSDSALWLDSVFKLVSVLFGKCTTLMVTKSDQWISDYRVVTNEKPRNWELF